MFWCPPPWTFVTTVEEGPPPLWLLALPWALLLSGVVLLCVFG